MAEELFPPLQNEAAFLYEFIVFVLNVSSRITCSRENIDEFTHHLGGIRHGRIFSLRMGFGGD
jgi:hypothetical protein